MVVLQRIKKPKNKRSVRALEAREPKAIGKSAALLAVLDSMDPPFFFWIRSYFSMVKGRWLFLDSYRNWLPFRILMYFAFGVCTVEVNRFAQCSGSIPVFNWV
jgi:hypothetical protein